MTDLSAMELASFWERRLSPTSLNLPSPNRTEFPDPFPKPPPKRLRSRADVSAKKPPVAPPLLSAALTAVEEIPLSDAAVDAMSPVSSYVASQPSSPGLADHPPFPARSRIIDDIARLRRVVRLWDFRLAELELRQRCLMKQLGRLSAPYASHAQSA